MSNNTVGIAEPRPTLESLTATVQALREQIQVINGDKGDILDRAVTLRDLLDYRILSGQLSDDWVVSDITRNAADVVSVVGFPDKAVTWVQESGGGTWSPSTPQDIVVTFLRGSDTIATHTVRGALNTGTGDITVTSQATTGEASTLTVTNNTTTTPTVDVVHDDSNVKVPLVFVSIQGGLNGNDGADGTNGTDGADGTNGVIPPSANWGTGLTTIKVTPNFGPGPVANDGEVLLEAGTLILSDGTQRVLATDGRVNTPYEGATTPPTIGKEFYIMWGATNPDTRFGAGTWGNTVAEAAGLFCCYYNAAQWTAIDDAGTTYNFTPQSSDYIFAIGFKSSASGGIDSMSTLAPYTGELGLFDSLPVGKIDPNVVDTLALVDEAITNAKLALAAVQEVNIDDDAISTTKIQDDAITTPKILAGAVTANEIAANTITAANIAALTITAAEIVALAITGDKIAANAITAAKIAANTITASEIAGATITANELASNSVTASKINVANLAAISADMGTITAGSIDAALITTGIIGAGIVDASNIITGTLNADRIQLDNLTLDTQGGLLTIKDGGVDTGQLAAGSVGVPDVTSGVADQIVNAGATVQLVETGVISLGTSGSAFIMTFGEAYSYYSNGADGGMDFKLYVDTGSGYQLVKTQRGGVRTQGGDTDWNIPISLGHVVSAVSTVRVRLDATSIVMSGDTWSEGSAKRGRVKEPTIVVFGAKR